LALGTIDERLWISILLGKPGGTSSIRIMDGLALDVPQLRNPLADVITVPVKLLTLQKRIEDVEVSLGVNTCRRTVAPASIVGGEVVVNETFPSKF
jgi:hypothetical protein